MKYTPIHVHTEYSFHESTIKIDDLIQKAKEIGLKSLCITDRNVMFGVSEFIHKTLENGIKPIIGLDVDVQKYRFILLAKNYDGYKFLCKISTLKMKNKEVNISDLLSNIDDIFIIDHPEKGYYRIEGIQLEHENFFIGNGEKHNANSVFIQEGKILKDEDKETLELLLKMNNLDIDVSQISPINFHPDTNDADILQAIKIIDECNIDFSKSMKILPEFKVPEGYTSVSYMKKIIQSNSQVLPIDKNKIEEYKRRIKLEVDIIDKLGFADYFLIIWDLIKWSRERGIVIGPGRGSAAGSLIAYLLNITEIDPIKYDLLFERFLNPERISMPDIDIDIQDNRRNEVVAYIFQKYGEEYVALISTFSRLGAKSSLKDVARYMGIPVRDVNAITKLIDSNLSLAISLETNTRFRAIIESSEQYNKLFKLSTSIEGLPRQFSTHAAGIVISNTPINDKAPTLIGNENLNQVQYPMDFLEENNLLKIDLLGLKNLTILKKIQDEIFINHNKKVDLQKIPLNDPKTNELLSEGDTNGIFQLESHGMKSTLQHLGVNSLMDIVAILSLYRPGPMENIPLYASVKKGEKKLKKISPEIDNITKETHGIIIYQEQIMEIAQKFSGMSYGQADILRRAISKKDIHIIESLRQKFIDGAMKNGHSNELAMGIFKLIEKFANYGFNKSHAVAYAMLSYRMAYLKSRFKFEFYTSLIDLSISSQSSVFKYVSEAKNKGIIVQSPSVNNSNFNVINKNGKIILPLQTIKGFGNSAAEKILKARNESKFEDFYDFISRIRLEGIGESTIMLLIESNSLREFGNMQTLIDSFPSAIRYSNMITIKENGIDKIDKTIIPKPKLIKMERDLDSEIFNEKKLFGFQLNAFITEGYELEKKIVNLSESNSNSIVALIEKVRIMKSKTGESFAKITISDSTGIIDVLAFGKIFKFIDNAKKINRIIAKMDIEVRVKDNKISYFLNDFWKEIKNV